MPILRRTIARTVGRSRRGCRPAGGSWRICCKKTNQVAYCSIGVLRGASVLPECRRTSLAPGMEGGITATLGIRPLTETELVDQGPGGLWASAYHVGDVVRWMARVSPATSFLLPLSMRRGLLRLAGLRIGAQVTGLKQCGFETKKVSIGDGSFINVGCWFEGAGHVGIG